ncbi:MAG: permease [Elusimicrobiaceae bacterium]|nr:permease [Elusimicrobiaceae bacterium]
MEFIKEIALVIFSIFNEMSVYLLLGFLFAGILHVLVPQQLFSKYLSKNHWTSVFYATLFGIPLPLCSCGVIPTGMALYREGASKGSVVAFLIATPQTGIDSIIATYSLLGLPFAIIRPIVALFTAMFAGLTTNIFTSKESPSAVISPTEDKQKKLSFTQKLKNVFYYGYVEMMEDIGKMLMFGLIVAGLISYFVPDNFFMIFGNNTLLTMLLVLLVAIPMYVCATGSIPIAIALMMKGMSPGTALVLLMAGPAANIASMMVIGKVLGKKTFVLYLTTLIIGAITCGLIIDNFLPAVWFDVSNFAMAGHHGGHFYHFKIICSIILFVLFVNSLIFHKHSQEDKIMQNISDEKAVSFKINGMNCNHCKNNVIKAISNLKAVKSVEVNLSQGIAYVKGNVIDEEIKTAVEAIGFEFKGRI